MYFGGFTLNLMTLGGLALGVGMLVDNAIVVLENIYRLREDGAGARARPPWTAPRRSTAAIIASTLTTVVVFLPLVFVRGMAGVMFKQLPIVVSFSLLCSLVVALTLVPMLAARFLPPAGRERAAASTVGAAAVRMHAAGLLTAWRRATGSLLHVALNHRARGAGRVRPSLLVGSLAADPADRQPS